MNLYHFTAVPLGEQIFSEGLKNGHLLRADNSIEQSLVWLTSDQSHEGHGLPDGSEVAITESIRRYAKRATGEVIQSNRSADKTRLRLTLRVLEKDRNLISYVNYCLKNGDGRDYAKVMGLSACLELESLSNDRLLHLFNTYKTKEDSWYLYRDILSATKILAVDYRDKSGFVPYDFELHGRSDMEAVGMSSVAKEVNKTLTPFGTSQHKWDYVRAYAVRPHIECSPRIFIRGGGLSAVITLDPVEYLTGNSPSHHNPELLTWAHENLQELRACWSKAEEIYKTLFPQGQENF